MNKIKQFYNSNYFENLKITKPFANYLSKEEEKLRTSSYGGLSLDIGCGNGRSTEILSNLCKELIGIDNSKRLLTQAKIKLIKKRNVTLYLEDAKSTHFNDDTFDNIFMLWNTFGNLHKSRDKVLFEAKRILKPKGKIIITVFKENVILPYFEMLKQNHLEYLKTDKDYVYLKDGLVSERFTESKLRKIAKSAGLKIKIHKLTDITYWCELRK